MHHSNKKQRIDSNVIKKYTYLDRNVRNQHEEFFSNEIYDELEKNPNNNNDDDQYIHTMDVYEETNRDIKRYTKQPTSIKLIKKYGPSIILDPKWSIMLKQSSILSNDLSSKGFKEVVYILGDEPLESSNNVEKYDDDDDDDEEICISKPEKIEWQKVPLDKNIDTMFFIDKSEKKDFQDIVQDIDIQFQLVFRSKKKTLKQWELFTFNIVGKTNNTLQINVKFKNKIITICYYMLKNYGKFIALCLIPEYNNTNNNNNNSKYNLIHYFYLNMMK